MNKSQSPLPPTNSKKEVGTTFPLAIGYIIIGKKVHRLEWSDPEEYGLLKNSFLMIHRNGKFHTWIVSEGDMLAIDWIIMK